MKALAKIILSGLVVLSAASVGTSQCSTVSPTETTIEGGNILIVLREEGTYKAIAGKVVSVDGVALNGALVEVFDKPEYLLCDLSDKRSNCSYDPPADQQRKAACKTGKDGRFRFHGLPAGTYELRVSRAIVWNVAHDIVTIDPNDKKAKKGKITVRMTIGT